MSNFDKLYIHLPIIRNLKLITLYVHIYPEVGHIDNPVNGSSGQMLAVARGNQTEGELALTYFAGCVPAFQLLPCDEVNLSLYSGEIPELNFVDH